MIQKLEKYLGMKFEESVWAKEFPPYIRKWWGEVIRDNGPSGPACPVYEEFEGNGHRLALAVRQSLQTYLQQHGEDLGSREWSFDHYYKLKNGSIAICDFDEIPYSRREAGEEEIIGALGKDYRASLKPDQVWSEDMQCFRD